jgi:hypothetical protein
MSYRKLIFKSTASGAKAVSLPVHATLELTQSYEPLYARTVYRHMDGTAAVRQQWSGKLATEISARGQIPPGFSQLDFDSTMTIACVQHRSVTSTGTAITIPAARRTDVQHKTKAGTLATGSWYARAWDGDTYSTATGTTTSGAPNVVNITLASGEAHEHYEVVYLPKLTVICERPVESYQQNEGWSWSLRAEEV